MRASAARRGGIGLAAVLVVGIAGIASGASTGKEIQATLVKHVGPVGISAGQSADLVFTNGGNASRAVNAFMTFFDKEGGILARQQFSVAPGSSEVLEWVAPADNTIRGMVTLPGATSDTYPIAMHIYDPSGTSPALTTEVSPQHKPNATVPVYFHRIHPTGFDVNVTNLGLLNATFTVSFFDQDGVLLSAEAVTIAPKNTISVEFNGDASNGLRADLTAPDGVTYLVTGEFVGESGDRIVYNWVNPGR